MSTDYSDRKTREILTKVNGQNKLAEQAMVALIQRDPQFLQSLVTPYINGIILHAIERVRKQSGIKEQAAPVAKTSAAAATKPLLKKVQKPAPGISGNSMDNMMQALARSFEKNSVKEAAPAASGKVSQNHLDAMKALVKKTGK